MDPAVAYFTSDRPASKSDFFVKWINVLSVVDIIIHILIIITQYTYVLHNIYSYCSGIAVAVVDDQRQQLHEAITPKSPLNVSERFV